MTIVYSSLSIIVAAAAAALVLVDFGWVAALVTYAGVGAAMVFGLAFLVYLRLPHRLESFRSEASKPASKSAAH